MPNMSCVGCGNEFYHRASKIKYCSTECYRLHRYGERVDGKCLQCDKEIYHYTVVRKFCSSSCSATYNNTRRERKVKPKKVKSKKVKVVTKKARKNKRKIRWCMYCGDQIPSRHAKFFCSSQCSADKRTEDRVSLWLEDWKNGCYKNGAVKPFVKTFLLRDNKYMCRICGQPNEHNGLPLTLQLDHIDGDWKNNRPKNLRIVCPNCHTQTENYGSKNRSGHAKDRPEHQYSSERNSFSGRKSN